MKSMGRIFVGLVKCGAWGCFDEFNRLEEAVLSAVSMQIQAIQDSIRHHKNTCELLGKEVRKTTTGITKTNILFSSMDPNKQLLRLVVFLTNIFLVYGDVLASLLLCCCDTGYFFHPQFCQII